MNARLLAGSVRVVIVDDHPSVRRGLRALLQAHGERFCVVGEAGSVEDALVLLRTVEADVVITDLHMRPLDGLELMARRREERPDERFVVFTAELSVERARRALQAGAGALVVKDADEGEVVRAIEAVAAGYVHLPAGLARALNEPAPAAAKPQPTLRERDVLGCIAQGLTNKEIARRLGMEPRTVESHRAHIMRRFDLGSSAQLVKFAVERTWDTRSETG